MGVKLKINDLNYDLDALILDLSMINVMIGAWFGINTEINLVLFVLIIITIMRNLFSFAKSIKVVTFVILVIGIPFYNFYLLGGEFSIFIRNMWGIWGRFLIFMFAAYLMNSRKDFLIHYFKKRVKFFNYFWLCNIPFVLLQLLGFDSTVSLYGTENHYYVDTISGLFGMDGIAFMTAYVCFLFVYDWCYYEWCSPSKRKRSFRVYIIIWILCFSALSAVNDNKAAYLMLPLCAIAYVFVSKMKDVTNKRILKLTGRIVKYVVIYSIVLIFLFFIMYKTMPLVVEFVASIYRMFIEATNSFAIGGSNERFRMIYLAWTDQDNFWLGRGIGLHYWKEDGFLGFYHMGQADFGAFFLIGGMGLLIGLFGYMLLILNKIFKNIAIAIVLTVVLIIFSIYSLLFTEFSPFTSMLFFIMACWWKCNENLKESIS